MCGKFNQINFHIQKLTSMNKETFLLDTLSRCSVCLSMDFTPFCEVAAKTAGGGIFI